MPLFIRANRYLSLLACKGILKPMWKPMVGAINTPCSSSYGPWLNRTWECLSPLFSCMLAGRFFSLFLFYGMDCPHSSALICRGEAKGNWGALVVLWHQRAELRSEWISKWVLPRWNGHFKWSCGLQWQSTRRLPTESWPSKMLVYLYISAYAECVHCTIFPEGRGGWWKICSVKHTC